MSLTISRSKRIFVSDIHMGDADSLKPPSGLHPYSWLHSDRAKMFADFLELKLKDPEIKQIIILGDLFDEWVCPAELSPTQFQKIASASHNVPIINNLKAIAASDEIELIYVPGNHDMLMTRDILTEIVPGIDYRGTASAKGFSLKMVLLRNMVIWIHSANALSLNEKSYWLKKLCSDPGAHPGHRWGRCPGFRNRKEQYRSAGNRYPLSKLIWIDWKNPAGVPKILSHQPRGGVCQNSDISRSDYLRDDASATDFSYAPALIRRGCSDEETEQRLRAERTDWNNHSGEKRKQQYLERTIRCARNIIGSR
ncbi:MAG: hypothetical protein GY754_21350 [bacterium]|nr:hypothetical protein [bacterium]